MSRFLSGFLVGAILSGLVVGVVGFGSDRLAHARRMGRIDGLHEAVRAIESEFGNLDQRPASATLFSVKTSDAVAVVVDGVKTIRVVP